MKKLVVASLICCVLLYTVCKEKPGLPQVENIVEFKAESLSPYAHDKSFMVEKKDLEHIITTYTQISQEHWLHHYHHIAMNDIGGTIVLKDGTEIQWMVRPGGLATLTYPDGYTIYLAKELHKDYK